MTGSFLPLAAAAALLLAVSPALAKKGYCEDGSKKVCHWVPGSPSDGYGYYDDNGQYLVRVCHCKSQEGGGWGYGGSYGHAEIHKSHVPQVQPNPHPGSAAGMFRRGYARPFAPQRGSMMRSW